MSNNIIIRNSMKNFSIDEHENFYQIVMDRLRMPKSPLEHAKEVFETEPDTGKMHIDNYMYIINDYFVPFMLVLYAYSADELVGGCVISYRSFNDVTLTDLVVKESHEGKGIGKSLLGYAEVAVRRLNKDSIFLEVRKDIPAEDMYIKSGYVEEAFYPSGMKQDDIYCDITDMHPDSILMSIEL